MDNGYIKIGYVAKTHGLKGGVTIVLQPDAPALETMKSIFIEINRQLVPYMIEEFSDRTDKAFVRFEDVSTPEQALALRGASLYISRQDRSKSGRGEFYDDEVIGFDVDDISLGHLGQVREVLQMGPNRLLAVDGKKEILIPVNGPFITGLNKSKKKFTVDLPEGFLDI